VADAKHWVKKDPSQEIVFWPTDELKARTWVSDESINDKASAKPESFWSDRAIDLHWFKTWARPISSRLTRASGSSAPRRISRTPLSIDTSKQERAATCPSSGSLSRSANRP